MDDRRQLEVDLQLAGQLLQQSREPTQTEGRLKTEGQIAGQNMKSSRSEGVRLVQSVVNFH